MNSYHISRFEKSLVDVFSEATARVYLQYFSLVNDTGSSRSACTSRLHAVTAQGIHLCGIRIKISFPACKACTGLAAS